MDNSTESPSRYGGTVGAALLTAVLFALVLGVYGAIYLNASLPVSMPQAARLTTRVIAPFVPTPVNTMVPAASSPSHPAMPTTAPGNIVTLARSVQVKPRPPVRSMPIQPSYWVEYGAYRGMFYAERLVRRLDHAGVAVEIKHVPGISRHLYYSVRSVTLVTRAVAEANARLAATQIGIRPLIHRGDRTALAHAIPLRTVVHAALPARSYWVQFGAYDIYHYAIALRDRLHRAGFVIILIERHHIGWARYVVRSLPLNRLESAKMMAAHGESVLGTATFVGESLRATGVPSQPISSHR